MRFHGTESYVATEDLKVVSQFLTVGLLVARRWRPAHRRPSVQGLLLDPATTSGSCGSCRSCRSVFFLGQVTLEGFRARARLGIAATNTRDVTRSSRVSGSARPSLPLPGCSGQVWPQRSSAGEGGHWRHRDAKQDGGREFPARQGSRSLAALVEVMTKRASVHTGAPDPRTGSKSSEPSAW